MTLDAAPRGRPGRPCRDASTPLRAWRLDTGRTFAWLARHAGVDLRTVRRVAAGSRPSGDTALRLADASGLSVGELLRAGRGRHA